MLEPEHALIDSFEPRQWPVRSPEAGLATHLSLALLPPAAFPLVAGQSIRGWRFGGSGGVVLLQPQLSLQVGYLLPGVGNALLLFSEFLGLFAQLLRQPLHLERTATLLAGARADAAVWPEANS